MFIENSLSQIENKPNQINTLN